jgi:hypothetical protein
MIQIARVLNFKTLVATGEERGLEQLDADYRLGIADPACPVKYVITQRALAEGWDCPFAYILVSMAALHSATAVEQLLGRVLRQPEASHRAARELNQSYAFVVSRDFAATASALRDRLVVGAGFERREVSDFGAAAQVSRTQAVAFFQTPAEAGIRLRVPQLALRVQGELRLFDDSEVLDYPWDLTRYPAVPEEDDLAALGAAMQVSEGGEIDIDQASGRVISRFLPELQRDLGLVYQPEHWDRLRGDLVVRQSSGADPHPRQQAALCRGLADRPPGARGLQSRARQPAKIPDPATAGDAHPRPAPAGHRQGLPATALWRGRSAWPIRTGGRMPGTMPWPRRSKKPA